VEAPLCVPATFRSIAEPGTWRDFQGGMHRIDFVALPIAALGRVSEAFVDTEFDMMNAREDHHPAVVKVSVEPKGCDGTRWKQINYDKDKLNDQKSIDNFVEIIQRNAAVEWDMGVDAHLAHNTAVVAEALEKAFPTANEKKERHYQRRCGRTSDSANKAEKRAPQVQRRQAWAAPGCNPSGRSLAPSVKR